MNPVWSSWPSLRHAAGDEAGQLQLQNADQQSLLTYEQLRTWLHALKIDDNSQLVISSDSLRLLPPQLPYELLGPLVLAAVDGLIANKQQQLNHLNQQQDSPAVQRKLALQDRAGSAAEDQQQDQQLQQHGLQLVGIDLQQPVAAPLTTCMAAYSCLQQLSLQELNIDVCAAQALGSILHSASSSFSSNGCSTGAAGCSLRSLTLDAVFMCDMAWQALCEGLAAGCELHTIRLLKCLQPSSLPALAAALAGGCQQLRELEMSHNSMGYVQSNSSNTRDGSSSQALAVDDAAWSCLIEALQCCTQLQMLSAVRCSLGPKAACAVAKLLRGNECGLRQLNLGQCSKMGTEALSQVVAAAASCRSLQQLNLSSTCLRDAGLKPLTQGSSSSWISRGPAACRGLKQLAVGGNCWLSGAAVGQMGKAMAAGGQLCGLTELSLAGCTSVGDEGAVLLAAALTAGGGRLRSLDMSGCELTDAAAAALAGLLAATPAAEAPAAAAGGFRSPLKWRTAAAAVAVPAEKQVQLLQLRLVENQITSAGIQALAKAVGSSSCRLQLLDVSFNWVGPQGMQPLMEAAAAAAAAKNLGPAAAATNTQGVQQQQQHGLQVLRECLPEYWRVEAAKQAAVQALAADADINAGAAEHSSSLAADTRSLADSSSCSGSCCSQAGTAGSKALSDGNTAGECIAAAADQGATPDKQQLWMFNTLFCHEGGLSRASSAIAIGMYDGSDDICNHYDDSDDGLSDVDSGECIAVAASASSSSCGSPALLSSDNGYRAALLGVDAAPRILAPSSSQVSFVQGCKEPTAAAAAGVGPSTAGSVKSVGAESSSGSMEDAPAALPGHCKQLSAADHHHTNETFGVGPGSPKKDQARTSSSSGATNTFVAAAQPAAAAAAAQPGRPLTKLVPKPPDMLSSRQGSVSSGGAGPDWLRMPGAAPTPGLKTLRTMRQRVSNPAVVSSQRTSVAGPAAAAAAAAAGACPVAGSRSPARTAGGAAASKLTSHRLHSVSDAADAGASAIQHVKAAASSTLAVESSTLAVERSTCGIGGSGSGSPAGALAVTAVRCVTVRRCRAGAVHCLECQAERSTERDSSSC